MDYKELDNKLKRFESQRIAANKNRRDLYMSYDRSTLISNLDDPEVKESLPSSEEDGLFSSMWNSAKDNISNLWNSINEDMDIQNIDQKLHDVSQSKQDIDDLNAIQDYMDLLMQRDNIRSIGVQTPEIQQKLADINAKIEQYDNYFKGEGRTHEVIMNKMFDGTQSSNINLAWQAIKSGWNNSGITLDLYDKGIIPGLAGSAVEGTVNLLAKPLGVLGEILSGAYGEVKAGYDKLTKDNYSNSQAVKNYISNIAQDGDDIVESLYIGDKILDRQNIHKDLLDAHNDAERDYYKNVENVIRAQNDLKYGKVFGIPGLYDKDAITQEWRQDREDFQNGSLWGAFIHPLFATADIASSLDMMKYQIGAQGVDMLIKRIPEAFVKKIPGLGTALAGADIATGVAAAFKSREEETALEAIDAIGTRVQQETQRLGGNPEEILERIKEYGNALGIRTDELNAGQLWKLGVAMDVHAGTEFEKAKQIARQGINKLINANNALGISDWAQSLPYMSYFGDVTKALKVPGNKIRDNFYIGDKTLGQRLGTKLYAPDEKVANFKYAEEMEKRIDGIFDGFVDKAAKKLIEGNHAKLALLQKHALQYIKNKGTKVLGTSASEMIEEGQQQLLQSRYNRGEYDDYKKETSMFDINEFVLNNALATTAVADYFGAGWWDANNGDSDLVKAMNIGFWSSVVQGNMHHALTNITEPNGDNIRGLARQLRSDNVAVRILADQQKNLQDQTHIDMFYDRFMNGGNWSNMLESLSTLSKSLDNTQPIQFKDPVTGQTRSMLVGYAKSNLTDEQFKEATGYTKDEYDRVTGAVKKQFIDDDIKLMTNTWSLFNDKNIDRHFKEKSISKKSEEYRQFLRDGATALTDFYKSGELLDEQKNALDAMQETHIDVITKLLDDSTPAEEKKQLMEQYPSLANVIDVFESAYGDYLKNRSNYSKFLLNPESVTSGKDLYDAVGKEAIESFGIDKDILATYRKKKRGKKHKGESRQKQSAARIMADRIVEQGRVGELMSKLSVKGEEEFKNIILSGKTSEENKSKFRNNKFVNQFVNANKPNTRPWLGDLDEIFDNEDKTEFNEIIHGAYLEYMKPMSKKDFVVHRARILHQYKKMQAIVDNLGWTQNQEQTLQQVRFMTGLDVDPSNIQGWIDTFNKHLEMMKKQEAQLVGNDTGYKDVFDESLKFDDDERFQKTYADYSLNNAIYNQQAVVAAAYKRMQMNPESLRTSIYGKGATETVLDEEVNEYNRLLNEHNSKTVAERTDIDEEVFRKDVDNISERAAWKLIESRIKDRIERNKVAHRQFDENQTRPEVQPFVEQKTEEGSSVQTTISQDSGEKMSEAEKALRKDFYYEDDQKKSQKELIEESKKKRKQKQGEADKKEDLKEEVASETQGSIAPEIVPQSPDATIGEITTPVEGTPVVNTEEVEKVAEVLKSEEQKPDSVEPESTPETMPTETPEVMPVDQPSIGAMDSTDDQPDFLLDPNDPSANEPDNPNFDPRDSVDYGFIEENEDTGFISMDGERLGEEDEKEVRKELEDLEKADKAPLTIDQTADMSDQEVDDIVGEAPINLIWRTCFYKYDEFTNPIKLTVNGKQITSFNGKPLKPGGELAKKLLIPTWLQSCKTYYVVTQPEESKNKDKNDTDAFTVSLVIEDKDASYAVVFRGLGETISISEKEGRDGNKKQYHINRKEILRQWLLLKNMDTEKVLRYVEKKLKQPVRSESDTDEDFEKALYLYRKQIEDAYKKAINEYARNLYASQYEQLHRDDRRARKRGEEEWDSISKNKDESEKDYQTRLEQWKLYHTQYTDIAREYFGLPDKPVYSAAQIEDEINKLKVNRDEIINAYLDKDDKGNYIFPENPKIDYVQPASVKQSNGRIDSRKKKSGLPELRTVTGDAPIDEIQKKLDSDEIILGVGKGARPKQSGAKTIVSFGHILAEEENVLYKKGGLSGKIYWMVSSLTGKGRVPIMLAEEKFNIQHRESDEGGLETVSTRDGSNKIKLLIEKVAGKLEIKKDKYKPSAAEVLLYMILGENVVPGINDARTLVPLFIHEDPGTLLEKQPETKDGLLNNLASKQLYYGPSVGTETVELENGKKVTRKVVSDSAWMFNIGLKHTKALSDILGEPDMVTDGHYAVRQFTKDQILNNDQLRQYIVQAISEQMHWNTDAATFKESASVAIHSSTLGKLISQLIDNDAEAGRFDGMSTEEYLNSTVSIMGCPQLSFRIGDFFTKPEDGANNLASLEPINGSVMAWMLKSGHLMTDTSEDIFKAPFVFANGVKTAKKDTPAQKVAKAAGTVVQKADIKKSEQKQDDLKSEEAENSGNNIFFDETKQQRLSNRLPTAMRKGVVSIPKTTQESREKLKEWTEFLLSDKAKDSKFAGRIDVKENDILDMIVLQDRTVDDIVEYSQNNGDFVSEDDDEELDKADKQMLKETIDSLIKEYNASRNTKLTEPDQWSTLSYSARQKQKASVEAVIVYKNKQSGDVKYIVTSINADSIANKANAETASMPVSEKRYNIKAATGVYSKTKSKGEFDEAKAREWLADKLGIDQANVIVMNGIKSAVDDVEVFGVVDSAVNTITNELFGYISLSRRGGSSVHYHEAWHYVNLLLHDEQSRVQIYKAYLKAHPFLRWKHPKYGEVEERLAEDFRKWMALEEDTSKWGAIKRMFNNVLDTILIFRNKDAYVDVFKAIKNGDYKGKPLNRQAVKEFHDTYHKKGGAYEIGYSVPSLTKEEDKNLTYIYNHQQLFDAAAALAKHFIFSQKLETEKDLKRISGTLVDDIYTSLSQWVDESTDMTEDNKNILRDVLKNPARVQQAINEQFEELGLTAKIRTIKDLDRAKRLIENPKAEEEGLAEDSSVEYEAEQKEDKPDNTWDVFDLSVSKKDNASIRTKLFMKQIPVLTRVIDAKGNITYKQKYDDYGNEELWSYNNAWNFITDHLWLCESIDEVDKDGNYKQSSMMGMIQRLAEGNTFFYSLLQKMNTIDSSKFQNTILKSQLFATVNSNKPQVSFLTISDPIDDSRFSYDDFGDSIGSEDYDATVVTSNTVADRQREWHMHNDNTVEANRNLLRQWSSAITGQGMIEINKEGKAIVSKNYALRLKDKIDAVRKIIKDNKDVTGNKKLSNVLRRQLIPAVVSLYDEIGITTDEDVIFEFVNQTLKNSNPSVQEQWDVIKQQFEQKETYTEDGKTKTRKLPQDNIPRIIDAIIEEGVKPNEDKHDYIKYTGDRRQHSLDRLFNGFMEDVSSVYRMANAINVVHPSARQFSVKDPSGNTIYPISSNSFVSDRARKLSIDGKNFGKRMKKSKYCQHSQLLNISINNTDPVDTNTHFKLNAFVGIKDGNRSVGADYFGITPMEDYLAKMTMLEKDQIVLPTMADKKTWYSISHKDLNLCHDAIMVNPHQNTRNEVIYDEYQKDHPKPETEDLQIDWRADARRWFRNLEPDSEVKLRIDEEVSRRYREGDVGVSFRRFSDSTLKLMGNYMLDELEAVIEYYSPKNVSRVVKNKNVRVQNYHGNVKNGRMDFSGNGGKFRYFYDMITFTDDNGNTYNLNQRLQMLFELQKKIESGNVKNISTSDPIHKYIGGLVLGGKNKNDLDGFELIRKELESIREQYFKNGWPSRQIKDNINDVLMKRINEELESLSDPQNPAHMLTKEDGMYKPYAIPAQLLKPYMDQISGKLKNTSVDDPYGDGDDIILSSAAFSLIANTVVNSAISVIEFEKVFSGDPAFYSRKTLTKISRVDKKSSLPKEGKGGVLYIASDTETAYQWNGNKFEEVESGNISGANKIEQTITFEDGSTAKAEVVTEVVYDSFSDKIKRLGSTLSPGDEIRLYYSKEELEKPGRRMLSIDSYTNMNVEDIQMQSVFIDQIEDSFRRQLVIDNIRTLDQEPFEKYCNENGMSFEDGIQRIYKDDQFFKKIYDMFKDRKAAIEKALKVQIKPYTDITVSDAQVFIRPELYRRIRIGLGQWSNDDEYAYMILEGKKGTYLNGQWMSDPKVYNAVRKLQLYPLKMSYFQNDPMDYNGTRAKDDDDKPTFEYNKPILNKMAIFPWFRFMAGNGVGAQIYERMNLRGNELDMISFKSAVKVGAVQKGAEMNDGSGQGEDQLHSIDPMFFNKSSQYIDYDDNPDNADYGKIKSNTNADTAPVEIQYLQNLRYQLNTEAHEAETRNIGTQMAKLIFSSIVDDAQYGADENGKNGIYGRDVKKQIMETITKLTDVGMNRLHKRFFTNGQINFDAVHDYIVSIARNNNMGYTAEQIARNGTASSLSRREIFENSATAIVNSELIDINTPGGTAVQQSCFGFSGYGNSNVQTQLGAFAVNFNDGKVLKWNTANNTMEVMISMNFFRHVLPTDLKNATYEKQRAWLIEHDIIAGTKADGSKSQPQPFGVGYRIPTQGLSSIFGFTVADVLPPQCGDLIIVPPEFTAQTGSDFDVDKLFLATRAYKNGVLETLDEDNPTKGGLTNRLLDLYLRLLCDDKNYSESRASIDTFTKMLKSELIDAEGVLRDPRTKYIPSFTELTPLFQMNRKLEFSVGKEGIAPFALNVTNLALTQNCHLTMHYSGPAREYNFGNLDAIEGQDGLRISGWLSAMVNAHVDVAKDPYIFDLNVNHATYNYANFLIRAGKGMSTFTFLAQQSLKNIASSINNSGGIYGGNPTGTNQTDEISSVSKSAAIKSEYKNLKEKLESLKKDIENDKNKSLDGAQKAILDQLIEYAQYKSVNFHKSDEKEPKFEFDRSKVFDKDYAIKQLKNRRSNDKVDKLYYLQFQLACIRAFEELSVYAQGISDLVSASQVDTKKFGNTIRDHINFLNKVEHFMTEGSIWTINQSGFEDDYRDDKGRVDRRAVSKAAVKKYFEDSFLKYKLDKSTDMVRQILRTQLVTATDEYGTAFKTIMTRINGGTDQLYAKEFNQDKIDAIGQAIDNLFRFNILFNVGNGLEGLNPNAIDFTMGGDRNAVINRMRNLIYGTEEQQPLYQRLYNFKASLKQEDAYEKYPGIVQEDNSYSNDLIDSLIPMAPNGKTTVGQIMLKYSNRDTDVQKKSKMVASFAQLLSSNIPEVKELADDLAFYSYYSMYDQDVRNSFFDLVPPEYREQYDEALKFTLRFGLNGEDKDLYRDAMFDNRPNIDSNEESSGKFNADRTLDIICRNYWYDDNIVPRHYQRGQGDLNKSDPKLYGSSQTSEGVDGFPRFVCMGDNDFRVKRNPYFKIRIKNKSVLYRKVGVIDREYIDGEKKGELYGVKTYVFAPVPKAGYHANGIHYYELYADFDTPSTYKDNRLSPSFSMESVRQGVQNILDEYNKTSTDDKKNPRKFEASVTWDTEEIPELYDVLNQSTYKELPSESDSDIGNIGVTRYGGSEAMAWHKSAEKADVIINLSDEEEPSLKNIPKEEVKKVITININKPLTKEQKKFLKDNLSQRTNVVLLTKPFGKVNVTITKDDIEEYLQSYGEISEKAKASIRQHPDWFRSDVELFVASKNFAKIWDDLSLNGIHLHSLYQKGDTFTSKMIQYAMNTLNDSGKVSSATINVSAVEWVGKLSKAKRMHSALSRNPIPQIVEQDISSFAEEMAKSISVSDNTQKVNKLVDEMKNNTENIDTNDLKMPEVESQVIKEVPNETTDDAENKKCAGDSAAPTTPKKKNKFSVSENIED